MPLVVGANQVRPAGAARRHRRPASPGQAGPWTCRRAVVRRSVAVQGGRVYQRMYHRMYVEHTLNIHTFNICMLNIHSAYIETYIEHTFNGKGVLCSC